MRRKTLLLGISTAVLLGGTIGLAANLNGGVFNVNSEVKYAAKDIVLTIDANNVSTGSGSVVLNGNLFNYSNLVVENGKITLGAGARITAAEPSGNGVAANGMKGMGFDNMAMMVAGPGSATASLNSVDIGTIEFTVPDLIEKPFAPTPNFDFEITSGSLIVSRLMLHYECKPAETPATQKVLFVGSDSWVGASYKFFDSYVEALPLLESGATASVDFFHNGSFNFTQIADIDFNYENQAQLFRDKLFSDNWDAVVYQLSRRVTPSGTNFLSSEENAFFNIVLPLTRLVTNNITLITMNGSANPTIFDIDEDGQSVSTETTETMTAAEHSTYMDSVLDEWVGMPEAGYLKIGKFASLFDLIDVYGSSSKTKARAYGGALMTYACVNETEIPTNIADIWTSTVFNSTSSTAKTIKNHVAADVNELVFG